VEFDMLVETEEDLYKINYLTDRVDRGKQINMREMARWCHKQGIKFETQFLYKKDFTLTANIWNLYTYCRFVMENLSMK